MGKEREREREEEIKLRMNMWETGFGRSRVI